MRMLHLGLALALLIGWTVAAEAAKPKGQKKGGATAGVVTAVNKDGGTIAIQVRQGKKNKDAPAIEKTFKVTNSTTFQTVKKVKGQKGKGEQTVAVFGDVQKGSHVRIQATGDVAVSVTILSSGKKK
ncbi:MAG TPA: hypothetical protein VN688_08905 [Gemmataceae bacterium]|nr:hypothetical protein [Gemmataceae bacterium]